MRIPASLSSEFTYFRRLLAAGLNTAAADQDEPDVTSRRVWVTATRSSWLPAVIGMAVGVSAVCLSDRTRSGRGAVLGALAGGALGFGGGVAWGSRDVTTTLVRHAAKNIGVVRDDHWLEKHPICYG
jgi:hypothetical protein